MQIVHSAASGLASAQVHAPRRKRLAAAVGFLEAHESRRGSTPEDRMETTEPPPCPVIDFAAYAARHPRREPEPEPDNYAAAVRDELLVDWVSSCDPGVLFLSHDTDDYTPARYRVTLEEATVRRIAGLPLGAA